jgi:hypothetical protein
MFYAEWLTSNARLWIVRAPCRAVRYIVNTFRGARPVMLSHYVALGRWERINSSGEIDWLDFGGACPVQGYGTIDGRNAYYRSRGTGWSLKIVPPGKLIEDGHVEWQYWSGRVYHFPDGGWIHPSVSIANLDHAVTQYYKEKARSL